MNDGLIGAGGSIERSVKISPHADNQEPLRVVVKLAVGAPLLLLPVSVAPIAPEPFVPEVSAPVKVITVIDDVTLCESVAVTFT
jgi:hypothetical protein